MQFLLLINFIDLFKNIIALMCASHMLGAGDTS